MALLGDEGPLLADATMTGTVNPDGTVGPVGGIPLKVSGVAEAGFTRFGIPLGQRHDVDPCTGEVVDVVELGKSLLTRGDDTEAPEFPCGDRSLCCRNTEKCGLAARRDSQKLVDQVERLRGQRGLRQVERAVGRASP